MRNPALSLLPSQASINNTNANTATVFEGIIRSQFSILWLSIGLSFLIQA
jgi:hypothetical protein